MPTIEELQANYVKAEQAAKEANEKHKGAALALAKARTEDMGIFVGSRVEYHKYANETALIGEVLRIDVSRWKDDWGKDCDIHMVAIKKDGTAGTRKVELSLRAFLPGYRDEAPKASVIPGISNT